MNVVMYHNGDYWMPAVVKRGIKHLHVVHLTDGRGVVARTRNLKEERYMRPALFKGKPYPIERAVRIFKRLGRASDISKAALEILNEAKGGAE